MEILRAKLLERQMAEANARERSQRLAQVGTGDRSEKIRTYNFPQNRVTDHRISMTAHNLESVLNGYIDDFITELATREEASRLADAGI